MISDKIASALNQQLNMELYSSYLYLSMAAEFGRLGLDGFARWHKFQALEEGAHARKIMDHVTARGAKIDLYPIDKPQVGWGTPYKAMEAALQHEMTVSAKFKDLMELAAAEKDYATKCFLAWFITEQVEEEDVLNRILGRMNLGSQHLLLIDRELGERTM
jgi:ferritin